jgi:hypothetical protein
MMYDVGLKGVNLSAYKIFWVWGRGESGAMGGDLIRPVVVVG